MWSSYNPRQNDGGMWQDFEMRRMTEGLAESKQRQRELSDRLQRLQFAAVESDFKLKMMMDESQQRERNFQDEMIAHRSKVEGIVQQFHSEYTEKRKLLVQALEKNKTVLSALSGTSFDTAGLQQTHNALATSLSNSNLGPADFNVTTNTRATCDAITSTRGSYNYAPTPTHSSLSSISNLRSSYKFMPPSTDVGMKGMEVPPSSQPSLSASMHQTSGASRSLNFGGPSISASFSAGDSSSKRTFVSRFSELPSFARVYDQQSHIVKSVRQSPDSARGDGSSASWKNPDLRSSMSESRFMPPSTLPASSAPSYTPSIGRSMESYTSANNALKNSLSRFSVPSSQADRPWYKNSSPDQPLSSSFIYARPQYGETTNRFATSIPDRSLYSSGVEDLRGGYDIPLHRSFGSLRVSGDNDRSIFSSHGAYQNVYNNQPVYNSDRYLCGGFSSQMPLAPPVPRSYSFQEYVGGSVIPNSYQYQEHVVIA